ncbi:MAG: zf-HC2 domain-containing protein [Ardenticatenaceae bacterium]
MTNNAPHPYRLRAFADGELNNTEEAIVSKHVSECDACFAYVEEVWNRSEFTLNNPDIKELMNVPELSAETVQKLEQQLFGSLHRSSLGANTILLGTKGFVEVFFAILKPLFGMGQNSHRTQRPRTPPSPLTQY